ncbi:enoyl-CoA hydratase-related protein [Zhongshania sp.]|jgi:2-(1,2-epoxy-1,2-dihydrophenyl)acetyl-CoA isomerase|uniref:enoyl-CoA hydratase/isomerase family protein n=1 Tax=Zhongshania sp. TaxID=1971902 RepID=UPI001B6D3864|nr:enoyl-CoA hydratase-related protein [Zhongshania sp.]MBQ0796521.1 enoyl-CoA hydratase/isomerase family protein [Zhongshania sp.]|tara:strand:- start:1520 stop:2302 length:783 start_codon:yes stop_codon:yes gene_type:complete
MSDYQCLEYKKVGMVAAIHLNRPDSLNAFNRQMRSELLIALEHANQDSDVRVVVLGANGRGFSSGADLAEGFLEGQTVEDQILDEYGPILSLIGAMDKTVIAASPGVMAGVGAAIAMRCDLLVMAETGNLMMAFSNVGLVPDGGASWQLLRYLGYQRCYALMAEGGRIDASICLNAGIANKLAPADQVLDTAMTWAEKLALRAPVALREMKKLLRQAADDSYDETVKREAKAQKICVETADAKEAMQAFFEKRPPVFRGE